MTVKIRSIEFELWPGLLTGDKHWEGWSFPDPMCTNHVKVKGNVEVTQYKMTKFEEDWFFDFGHSI